MNDYIKRKFEKVKSQTDAKIVLLKSPFCLTNIIPQDIPIHFWKGSPNDELHVFNHASTLLRDN